MNWVHQEHTYGCGPATLAMITGETYEAVIDEMSSWAKDIEKHPGDWNDKGVTYFYMDYFLIKRGYWLQRKWSSWFPIKNFKSPWAEAHFASVIQPSGESHFVAMESDGTVLDPYREGKFTLGDWEKVNNVVGLKHP